MSEFLNPPRNGEGDREAVEGALLTANHLWPTPSVMLRLPPPRAGED